MGVNGTPQRNMTPFPVIKESVMVHTEADPSMVLDFASSCPSPKEKNVIATKEHIMTATRGMRYKSPIMAR